MTSTKDNRAESPARSLRVLLVTPVYSPFVSGSARLLQDIVEHLQSRGHRPEVLTFGLEDTEGCQRFDSAQSYPIHRIPPVRLRGGNSAAMLARLTRLGLSRRYDLFLCGYASPTAILARAASRITGTPYAVYTHGEDASGALQETRRNALARALRDSRIVMANSHFSCGEVAKFGVPAEHITCVAPGIYPHRYAASKETVEALRARLGLEGSRVILTVARLAERKGHDSILRALPAVLRAAPDTRYLIVGKGDSARLRAIGEELNVWDRVTLVDYVPDEQYAALFHLCDIYAMVSRTDPLTNETEGLGLVYLEAAVCGKPSLAGNQGGCAQAVADGATGFVVDPCDVQAIADRMIRLLTEHDLAARMGEAGRDRVYREWDQRDILSRLESLLMDAARH